MIYIVMLNWNGCTDTLACLQSLSATKGVDYRILVCDNGSTDGSEQAIESWARGMQLAETPENPRLASLLSVQRQTSFAQLSLKQLNEQIASGRVQAADAQLTLISNQDNLGFAAGNNPGIRYALAQDDMTYVWLLNNDTLVEPDCLMRMVRRMDREQVPAICGSRVMFYDDPSIVQALGGNRFNKWTGMASPSLGRFSPEAAARNPDQVEQQLDYVSGCSMLLPRCFLEEIGLMEESYFLYYEEIDWAVRARGKYPLIYADDAVIYHKEGSAIGSASLTSRPSALSDFYCTRNRLRFTRKHFPQCLPICYLATLLQVLNRWRRGYWSSGWLLLKVVLGQKRLAL